MNLPDPEFPPLLTGHAVNAPATPFDTACRRAAAGELGAADLVWARATMRADMALVLEPDVPLGKSLEMVPLVFTAFADSLGALMPPNTSLQLRWPATILVNGGEAGRLRFAASTNDPAETPDWLVVGIELNLQEPQSEIEPGDQVHVTTLYEEGGGELDRTQILQSLSAHILTWINIWQDDGFPAVHDQFIGRVEGHLHGAPISTADGVVNAKVLGLSDEMELLIKPDGNAAVTALSLRDAIATAGSHSADHGARS